MTTEQKTLRSGLPAELVEDLLDIVVSVEEVGDYDEKSDATELWSRTVDTGDGTMDMLLLLRNCLYFIATGNLGSAQHSLDLMWTVIREYHEDKNDEA